MTLTIAKEGTTEVSQIELTTDPVLDFALEVDSNGTTNYLNFSADFNKHTTPYYLTARDTCTGCSYYTSTEAGLDIPEELIFLGTCFVRPVECYGCFCTFQNICGGQGLVGFTSNYLVGTAMVCFPGWPMARLNNCGELQGGDIYGDMTIDRVLNPSYNGTGFGCCICRNCPINSAGTVNITYCSYLRGDSGNCYARYQNCPKSRYYGQNLNIYNFHNHNMVTSSYFNSQSWISCGAVGMVSRSTYFSNSLIYEDVTCLYDACDVVGLTCAQAFPDCMIVGSLCPNPEGLICSNSVIRWASEPCQTSRYVSCPKADWWCSITNLWCCVAASGYTLGCYTRDMIYDAYACVCVDIHERPQCMYASHCFLILSTGCQDAKTFGCALAYTSGTFTSPHADHHTHMCVTRCFKLDHCVCNATRRLMSLHEICSAKCTLDSFPSGTILFARKYIECPPDGWYVCSGTAYAFAFGSNFCGCPYGSLVEPKSGPTDVTLRYGGDMITPWAITPRTTNCSFKGSFTIMSLPATCVMCYKGTECYGYFDTSNAMYHEHTAPACMCRYPLLGGSGITHVLIKC